MEKVFQQTDKPVDLWACSLKAVELKHLSTPELRTSQLRQASFANRYLMKAMLAFSIFIAVRGAWSDISARVPFRCFQKLLFLEDQVAQ